MRGVNNRLFEEKIMDAWTHGRRLLLHLAPCTCGLHFAAVALASVDFRGVRSLSRSGATRVGPSLSAATRLYSSSTGRPWFIPHIGCLICC